MTKQEFEQLVESTFEHQMQTDSRTSNVRLRCVGSPHLTFYLDTSPNSLLL